MDQGRAGVRVSATDRKRLQLASRQIRLAADIRSLLVKRSTAECVGVDGQARFADLARQSTTWSHGYTGV